MLRSPRGANGYAGPAPRIGAQDLDRAAPGPRRVGRRAGGAATAPGQAAEPVVDHLPGQPGQRRRVLPPLAKTSSASPDRRSAQLHLHVVVGGCRAVARRWRRPTAGRRGGRCRRGRRGRGRSRRRRRRRRPGPRCRRTTSFWWWLPSGRIRWSSSTSPPAARTAAASRRFCREVAAEHARGASATAARAPAAPRRAAPVEGLGDRRAAVAEQLVARRPASRRRAPGRPRRAPRAPRRARGSRCPRAPGGARRCPRSTPAAGWPGCRARRA